MDGDKDAHAGHRKQGDVILHGIHRYISVSRKVVLENATLICNC